nr:hypothetical protein [Desulfobulbaceae bacterium]
MNNEMIIRPAQDSDFLGLFILYVPKERYALKHGKTLSVAEITGLLNSSLTKPGYDFYVVEYQLEIIAAFGICKQETECIHGTEPVISDFKIAGEAQGYVVIEELIEHAILQGCIAGHDHFTFSTHSNTLLEKSMYI